MRSLFAAALALVARSGAVFGYDEDSSFTVPYPSRDFSKAAEAIAQAKESGYSDYADVVQRAARKDSGALKRLFLIDSKARWDAAGGELELSIIRQMLLIWGDYDFARVLGQQPHEIQAHVSAHFRLEPQDRQFAVLFPHTASIVERTKPKRPNQAMEPTTGRRTTEISMTPISHPAATRALASGGSPCSR